MNRKVLIYLGVLLVLANTVFAAGVLDIVVDPFGDLNFGAFYATSYMFIDGIIYLLIFTGLAKFVFGSLYKTKNSYGSDNQSSKAVSIGVGLALTFAAVFAEYQWGFSLGEVLIPPAMLIILLIMTFLLYELIHSISEDKKLGVCIAILIGYAMLRTGFSPLYDWMSTVPVIKALLHIALLVAFIVLLMRLFKMFSTGGDSPNATTNTDNPDVPETTQTTNTPNTNTPDTTNTTTTTDNDPINYIPPTSTTHSPPSSSHTPTFPPVGSSTKLEIIILEPKKTTHDKDKYPDRIINLHAHIKGGTAPYKYTWIIKPKNSRGWKIESNQARDGDTKIVPFKKVGDLEIDTYDCVVTVTDANGKTDTESISFKVKGIITDPKVSIIFPTKDLSLSDVELNGFNCIFEITEGTGPFRYLAKNSKLGHTFENIYGKRKLTNRKESFVIKKDNPVFKHLHTDGSKNEMMIEVLDANGKKGIGKFTFSINPTGGKKKLPVKIKTPEEGKDYPEGDLNIAWSVAIPTTTTHVFEGSYSIDGGSNVAVSHSSPDHKITIPFTKGSHTFNLILMNKATSQSFDKTINFTVGGATPAPTPAPGSKFTVSINEPTPGTYDLTKDANKGITLKGYIAGGTPPYDYVWHFKPDKDKEQIFKNRLSKDGNTGVQSIGKVKDLTPQLYTVTLEVFDRAGDSEKKTMEFTVDNGAKILPVSIVDITVGSKKNFNNTIAKGEEFEIKVMGPSEMELTGAKYKAYLMNPTTNDIIAIQLDKTYYSRTDNCMYLSIHKDYWSFEKIAAGKWFVRVEVGPIKGKSETSVVSVNIVDPAKIGMPKPPSWKVKVAELLKKTQAINKRVWGFDSEGSFGAALAKRPSSLKLTLMKKTFDSVKEMQKILNDHKAELTKPEYLPFFEKHFKTFTDNYQILAKYKDAGTHIIALCKQLGIDPGAGKLIEKYINPASIDNEKNATVKTVKTNLRRSIIGYYRRYMLFFRDLRDIKALAQSMVGLPAVSKVVNDAVNRKPWSPPPKNPSTKP